MVFKWYSRILIIALSIVIIVSCKQSTESKETSVVDNKKQPEKISLVQEWFPNANYAGEVVAINETDSEYNLELKLDAGSDNVDPIKLVLSGSNTFGVVGADKVLLANEKGADLVVVGVINYDSPTCFLSKKGSNIKEPKDFINKKVGVLTGTATEFVYRSLLKETNINKENLNEVEVPFDLTTFISGAYDVRPAFIYDEPVSLDLQNIEYNIIEPKNYGVSFLGTVYFTKKETVEKNPEIVQSFINSVAKGWEEALKNPEKAIKYLKKFDDGVDENRELLSLNKGMEYFKGVNGKVLYCDEKHWQEMIDDLEEVYSFESLNLETMVNNSFVLNYHSSK